jgi:hypothetical protein
MTTETDNQELVNIPDANSMKLSTQSAESIMETMATADEVRSITEAYDQPFYLFGEDRAHGIHWFDAIPRHWVTEKDQHLSVFNGTTSPGEVYCFQIGVYAPDQSIGELSVGSSDLRTGERCIVAANVECLSIDGIDFMGERFKKTLTVETGCVQTLWIAISIPLDARGVYSSTITVTAAGSGTQQLDLNLEVSGEPVKNGGDTDAWRLSRLRWLNSTLGLDDDSVPAPYHPLSRDGQSISLLGKRLTLGANGLPEQFESFFNSGNTAITGTAKPLFASPLRFVVETDSGELELTAAKPTFVREQAGAIEWEAIADSPELTVSCRGLMEFDGFIECQCTVTAKTDLTIKDIRVETDLHDDGQLYFTGLGQTGRSLPEDIDWSWNPKLRHDCFWLGNVNAGIRFELRGKNYQTPLVNAYYRFGRLKMPESWYNNGRSGITIRRENGQARIVLYSGARELTSGSDLLFQLNMNLTPFKSLDTDTHWKDRYLHQNEGSKRTMGSAVNDILEDPKQIRDLGANIFNIHHNNRPTPAINYPYWDQSFPALQEAVKKVHEHDVRFKVYYTSREITNLLPELWAFYSMNGEIIYPGPGVDTRVVTNREGPHPWLCEHMRERFIPAWRENLQEPYEGLLDLSVITTPDSRLDNFYIEGLNYLIEHAGIDGIYVDDTSLGRKTFQRAKRLILSNNPDGLIDLHSWNGAWEERFGNHTPMLTYMPNLPYVDRIWLGEAFNYDEIDPEMWLIDTSGIPLGLMGEMLQHGGNPWRGMVFGQSSRLGWGLGDPRSIWKLWDDFGMQGSEILGWWDPRCPVTCSDPDIYATVYRKADKVLISLGSWAETDVTVQLQIDWDAMGLDPDKVLVTQPAVETVQAAAVYGVNDAIPVSQTKGALLILGL